MVLFITIILVAIGVYVVQKTSKNETPKSQQPTHEILNKKGNSFPEKLLDLDTTTLAQRQRAYGRGFRLQQRYDILQRQAELAGDVETLEAIRTNTYNGPLPELEEEKELHKHSREPKIKKLQYFCIKDKGYHVSVWPKDSNNWLQGIDYVEFNIAGISHQDDIDNYLGEHKGKLEAEPTNPYDANAIKVLAIDGQRVGYIPKDMTSKIRKHFQLPCSCYIYIGNNNGTYYSDCYVRID